jgi:ribosome-associated protein
MSSSPEKHIQLDQFLKYQNIAQSGGEAKHIIQSGAVRVNGVLETRRGRKLYLGDVVEIDGEEMTVE